MPSDARTPSRSTFPRRCGLLIGSVSVRRWPPLLSIATKRASRTAVWPRLGRRLGITNRQSSCGVRISVSPSNAISVLRRDDVAAAIGLYEGEAGRRGGHNHRDLGEAAIDAGRWRRQLGCSVTVSSWRSRPATLASMVSPSCRPSAVRLPQGWRRTAWLRRKTGDSRSTAGRWHGHDRQRRAQARRRRSRDAAPFGDVPHRMSGSDGHSMECRSNSASTVSISGRISRARSSSIE